MAISDVVVVGGGPNGLMLACELALAGVRPIVLERLVEPSGEARANGLVGQVVRMLDRRGLYERLAGHGEIPCPAPGFVFGALPLDLSRVQDNPLYLLAVAQRRIVQVLQARAIELEVEIRGGHELTALAQNDDTVTAEITGPDGPYPLRAGFLVGADGGHSRTRTLSGIAFPGRTSDSMVSRSAHASVPARWVDPVTGALTVPGYGTVAQNQHHRTERGLFVFARLPGRPDMVATVEGDRSEPDDVPMTLEEMRRSVSRVLEVDVPLGPPTGPGPHLLRRRTGGNTRLAERFRDRRVLLLGDAAHVHSAIGGSGLNLGLQDAVNLGWKLAAEVHGSAPEGLLDSYQSERQPASTRVIMHTQAQAALICPGADVTALRELLAELLADPRNARHIAAMMAGADLRYDMGAGDHAHPWVGRWAPDLLLDTATGTVRFAELCRTARPLLLDLTKDASLATTMSDQLDRVDTITARPHHPHDAVTAFLIRPDGYVAWASTSPTPDTAERADLEAALRRWFGTTAPAPS